MTIKHPGEWVAHTDDKGVETVRYVVLPPGEPPTEAHRVGYRIKIGDDGRSVFATILSDKAEGDVVFLEFVSRKGLATRLIISADAMEAVAELLGGDFPDRATPEWFNAEEFMETVSHGPATRSDLRPATQEAQQETEVGNLPGGEGPLPEVP